MYPCGKDKTQVSHGEKMLIDSSLSSHYLSLLIPRENRIFADTSFFD